MSILQDSDFLERMLLSVGIPALLSASFFVWWLVDGAPEPETRVSALRRASPLVIESTLVASQRPSASEVELERADEAALPVESATTATAVEAGDAEADLEEEDTAAEARRARFEALEQQFNSELRSGQRAPETAEFLSKELSERFARLSSIDIDSAVTCTGSVCQVTLASTESLATLLSSSSGAVYHLLSDSAAGALSESEAAEARARVQARSEASPGQNVEGIRFLVPRESIKESATGTSNASPTTSPSTALQEGASVVEVVESDQPSGQAQNESPEEAPEEASVNEEDEGENEESEEE